MRQKDKTTLQTCGESCCVKWHWTWWNLLLNLCCKCRKGGF